MPTVLRERGFEVRLYTLDHPPPHVHVAKAGAVVRIDLATHQATAIVGSISDRDVKKAIDVLRADAEMDRLRNLLFMRHIENPENIARQASLQVIFMTQSLERAGDHAKNLAEEVCHFVSGRTVRHVLMSYDKPVEQMFIEWLRSRDEAEKD